MATSGNTTWTETRDSIIYAALRKAGALAKGQSNADYDTNDASEALNNLIVLFGTVGMPLWKRTDYPIALTSTQIYNLPGAAIKLAQVVIQDVNGSTQYDLI